MAAEQQNAGIGVGLVVLASAGMIALSSCAGGCTSAKRVSESKGWRWLWVDGKFESGTWVVQEPGKTTPRGVPSWAGRWNGKQFELWNANEQQWEVWTPSQLGTSIWQAGGNDLATLQADGWHIRSHDQIEREYRPLAGWSNQE